MGVVIEIIFFIAIAVAAANSKKRKAQKASGNSGQRVIDVDDDSEEDDSSEDISVASIASAVASTSSAVSSAVKTFSAPVSMGGRPGQSRQVKELCSLFGEDRKHDWMARQLREERSHMVWNNFHDLGARHDVSCAAQEARQAHHREHDFGVVDDGLVEE